jgi:hypothetical protein
MPEDGRHDLHGMGAGQEGLDAVGRGRDAARSRKRRAHATMEYGDPPKAQQQLGTGRQLDARRDRQPPDVEVGLIEAVEQHQPVGTRAVELLGHVAERREEWRQLHGDSDRQFPLEFSHDLGQNVLDRRARLLGVGDERRTCSVRARLRQPLESAGQRSTRSPRSFRSTTPPPGR